MGHITQEDRLKYILKRVQKNDVTEEELARKLNVSSRTIYNDVKVINQALDESSELKLDNGTYRFLIYQPKKVEKIIKDFVKESQLIDTPHQRASYLLYRLFDASRPLKLDDLAFELNIGRSTLNNDLKKIRLALAPYEIFVEGKPNEGIHVEGNEWDIRLYMIQNNDNRYFECDKLDQNIQNIIRNACKEHLIEEETEYNLIRFIMIALNRMTSHPIPSQIPEKYQSIIQTKEFRETSHLLEKIVKVLKIKLTQPEKVFITIPIVSRRSPVKLLNVDKVKVPEEIFSLIDEIKQQILKVLNIELNLNPIINEFSYHLTFMLNRLIFGIRLKNNLITEVKFKYPLAYKMAEISNDVIYEKYHVETYQDELAYLAYYFCMVIHEQEEKIKRIKRVAIVCHTGRGTAKIISIQLDKILDQNVEKKMFSSNAIESDILNTFDVIFSTVPIACKLNVPVILLSEIFDEKKILKKINQSFLLNKLNITSGHQHESLMSHLLSEHHFFVLDHTKRYDENLSFMLDELTQLDIVGLQFKQRVFEREDKKRTFFDNAIAFPHTVNKGSNQIVFALGVSSHPIIVDEKEIKLIFLLGIPENQQLDDGVMISLYDELISIAKNKDFVNKLSKTKNVLEVKRLFEMVN
ncbi:BglG family transcription antiterminator [Terrilactibacillus laevilacticus]|uniref:BglG family transcription antiterminator n=1 Tax=Terrilactibacillus laevilacticus TaxID=1380157 RepID=UPI0011478443|nr:PRD domain-containing protein [Terrilactibacillus laevilacticus]